MMTQRNGQTDRLRRSRHARSLVAGGYRTRAAEESGIPGQEAVVVRRDQGPAVDFTTEVAEDTP